MPGQQQSQSLAMEGEKRRGALVCVCVCVFVNCNREDRRGEVRSEAENNGGGVGFMLDVFCI